MVFILAPDSFKESMTAREACNAMERGIKKVIPQAVCIHVALADGGEGTLQALLSAKGGEVFGQKVVGPLGTETTGEFAILSDGTTGVIELASASGLNLVPVKDRNPLLTTTYGTGELIRTIIGRGIKKLIIGIGGSATNDGGAGIAQALGVRFLDKNGKEIAYGGAALLEIESIDTSGLITRNTNIDIVIACDVTNILTGLNGASYTYAPQKGATPKMVSQLDKALHHYAAKIKEYTGKDIEKVEGSGAAGGAGAGLLTFLEARLVKGIDLIMEYFNLEDKIQAADYVFTGEGSIDSQTTYGKTITGVTRLANQYNKPVIAFAGKIGDTKLLCHQLGLTSLFCILPAVSTLEEALQSGESNLENTVFSVVQLINNNSNNRNK